MKRRRVEKGEEEEEAKKKKEEEKQKNMAVNVNGLYNGLSEYDVED